MTVEEITVATVEELSAAGPMTTKLGGLPVVVFWHDGRPWAIEDRCPHLGFPLRQGTVESGMVTCHWHHARFDLESGCTLDPWADDAVGFDAEVVDGRVLVRSRAEADPVGRLLRRLRNGLTDGIDLVIAKSVLGLHEADVDPRVVVAEGLRFGLANRAEGWGAGLTILVAMANLLDDLRAEDRPLALFHGLRQVAADTQGHAPRFGQEALDTDRVPLDRLEGWYRRFLDTRSVDAAERALATAVATADRLDDVEALMVAGVTDHLFLDGGHAMDFTNKAFEALALLGADEAELVLGSLVAGTASGSRAEESSAWRHPNDLVALAATELRPGPGGHPDLPAVAERLLGDDPVAVVGALVEAGAAGASTEELARAVALAASLRLLRFHISNEHGDWDTVHHAFTHANAVHASSSRAPTEATLRAILQGALKVHLDRFLNLPAARRPADEGPGLDSLEACWEAQGRVDDAGGAVWRHVRGGGDPTEAVAALGAALLREDAGFHWFQIVEAGAAQARAWPDGSEAQAAVLAGVARFLGAHTPTPRTRHSTYTVARRLRRGDELFAEAG